MKTSEIFEGYCPEFQTNAYVRINYSVFRVLGNPNPCSKKISYYCENRDECSYCETNRCECPVFDEAPMDIDFL